ncbi:MAG: MG2 domain-containing protein, partial [Vicinamibacterales bacterium]
FSTVPLPKIVRTDPADGQRDVPPYNPFIIYFNAPINPDTVMPNLRMTPAFSPTLVYTTFNTYDNSFVLSYDVKPSTDYTVEIGPNIADPYGNTTGQSLTVRYRTAALPPDIRLHTPDVIATYNAYDPVRLYLAHTNVNTIDFNLYRLEPGDLSRLGLYDPAFQPPATSALTRSWSQTLESPRDEIRYTPIDLVEGGGRLEPGLYVLLFDSPQLPKDGNGSYLLRHHFLVVSHINLTLKVSGDEALVWATDHRSGQPVSGVPLTFYGDADGRIVGTATTDAQGIARIHYTAPPLSLSSVVSTSPFAAVASHWSSGISPYEFGIEFGYTGLPYNAFIYTDRPIYRPGQTVDFKGIVRAEDDVKFSLPDLGQVHVTIYDASYTSVYDKDLSLSELATFNDSLQLPEGASLGPYQINVTFLDQNFGQSFTVAAYRPPEFEVVVTPDKAEIARGEATQATAEVKYFFGGGLANTAVNWNVLAETYTFQPPWGGPYSFRDADDPWICFDCWWYTPYSVPEPILSGSGTTDAQGKLTIAIPADLQWSTGEPITGSVKLIVEAAATGPDNQPIAGRSEIVRHQGDIYVGLAARDTVAIEDRPARVDLVAVDWIGTRLPNRAIAVSAFRREWINT